MNKLILKMLIVIITVMGFRSLSEETDRSLVLEVKKNQVKLMNGKMRVITSPGMLTTTFSGPYGSSSGFGFHHPLKEIMVETNTDENKCVSLIGQDKNYKYTLKLTARANSPAIELKAITKNVGEYTGNRSFHYGLTNLKFPYYYDAEGWQYAAKAVLPTSDWFFLPTANTLGGYGLIPLNRDNLKISTYYSRQEDWEKVGLIFNSKKRILKPGETIALGFMIFPALNRWQVLEQFEKKK